MQFGGLQGLLKKKKAEQAQEGTPANSSGSSGASAQTPADPYLEAAQRALERRRQREALEATAPTATETPGNDSATPEGGDGGPVKMPRTEASATAAAAVLESSQPPPPPPPLLTDAEFAARRAEHTEMLRRMLLESTGTSPGAALAAVAPLLDAMHGAPPPTHPLDRGDWNCLERLREVSGSSEAERKKQQDDEGDTPTADSPSLPSTSSSSSQRSRLLLVLWRLTLYQWLASLRGLPCFPGLNTATAAPEVAGEVPQGYTYHAYLLQRQALPPEMRRTDDGRRAAHSMKQWEDGAARRAHLARLLACLRADEEGKREETPPPAQGKAGKAPPPAAAQVVPNEILSQLVVMFVPPQEEENAEEAEGTATRTAAPHAAAAAVQPSSTASHRGRRRRRPRNYAAAQNAYHLMTRGNSNWRLGLFTGNEVHMRRAIARVDRDVVAHLLNNESAMKMLHAARELLTLLQLADEMAAEAEAQRQTAGVAGAGYTGRAAGLTPALLQELEVVLE